jgi:hypothetical protein
MKKERKKNFFFKKTIAVLRGCGIAVWQKKRALGACGFVRLSVGFLRRLKKCFQELLIRHPRLQRGGQAMGIALAAEAASATATEPAPVARIYGPWQLNIFRELLNGLNDAFDSGTQLY